MNQSSLGEMLGISLHNIAYDISNALNKLYPHKFILEGESSFFLPTDYAKAEHCILTVKDNIHAQISTSSDGKNIYHHPENSWYEVSWQSHTLELLLVNTAARNFYYRYWIIADSQETAESFLQTVCQWCGEVRGEILVLKWGRWVKDATLFKAIKDATFDNLILASSLKNDIKNDIKRFFSSQSLHEEYGLAWKRGILLIGSPGNGKTHTVKALINEFQKPCLYVKSFHSYSNIHTVFERARNSAPCILVLEDIDSLVTNETRSIFLNELDGISVNTGILTLATTNYPEKLDPAIANRPGRFDRKYHFELPGFNERFAYITFLLDNLQANSPKSRKFHLSNNDIQKLAEKLDKFSFAYIKELFNSARLRWVYEYESQPEKIMEVMIAEADNLQKQMSNLLIEVESNPERLRPRHPILEEILDSK